MNKVNKEGLSEIDFNKLNKIYKESLPNEIDNPLKKSKKLLGEVKRIVPVKSPMVMMVFTNGKVKWFEDAKEGIWKYEGSDGIKKEVLINHKFLQDMMWGEQVVKVYICMENCGLPLPQSPSLYIDEFNDTVDKVITDRNRFDERRKATADTFKGAGEFIKLALIGLACLIGVVLVASYLGVDVVGIFKGLTSPAVEETVTKTIDMTVNNVSTV